MEALLELFFAIMIESVIPVVLEILVEAGLHTRVNEIRTRKVKSPIWGIIGYASLGVMVGGVSLLIFPHSLLPINARYHVISLIITPLLGGLVMSGIGWIRRRRGKSLIRLDSFAYGFLFAFGMALTRYLFAK